MSWIKRNLLFLVGLAVAITLLGVGTVYVLGSMQDAESVNSELETLNQKLDELVKRDPYPSTPNIEKTKLEQKRVQDFKLKAKTRFGSEIRTEGLDNASFKALLEGAISRLEREADRSGVKLPEKYDFTFTDQRKRLQLVPKSLSPLATQLEDLGDICHILFSGKIHSLISLKRTAVGTDETAGSVGILNKKVTSNFSAGTISYPYELSFQCFSAELGDVMGGFLNAPQNYAIKTINVERGTISETPVALAPVAPLAGMDTMMRRYGGMAGRYGPTFTPAPVPVAAATRAGETVLEEKPLKITIGLEVVKIATAPPAVAQPKTSAIR